MINDDQFRTLLKVPSEVEASILVAALAGYNVRAVTSGELTAGFRTEAPGLVSILVDANDLTHARGILVQIQQEQAEIDWSQVDVGDAEE